MVADLAPAEVHLVVTAREPLGLFTAELAGEHQEPRHPADGAVQHRRGRRLRRRVELAHARRPPRARAVVAGVPGRARARAAAARTGRAAPGDLGPLRRAGRRRRGLRGPRAPSFPNTSMGVVEAETLRRINAHLGDFNSAIDRGTYIRTFLADERLVPRNGRAVLAGAGPDRGGPRARQGGGRLHRRAGVRRDRRPRRRCWCPTSCRSGVRPSRSPTARWPRWPSSWPPGCCTTYATCGTSAATCGTSSQKYRAIADAASLRLALVAPVPVAAPAAAAREARPRPCLRLVST